MNVFTAHVVNDNLIDCVNSVSADEAGLDFVVTGSVLELYASTVWIPSQVNSVISTTAKYLVSSGVTLPSDRLSKACERASEVILPDSVTSIGVGFVIKLDTVNGQPLDVYIGENVAKTSSKVSIDRTANIFANDATNVAAFYRRCSNDAVGRKYTFDNLTPRDSSGVIDRTVAGNDAANNLHTQNDMRIIDNVDTCSPI